jgi:nucleotide-binding universal stress UspA family protein
MKNFHVKKILVPTDFSETGYLALSHAACMASLFKADLFLMHVIEITETTYNIYNPADPIRNISELQDDVNVKLNELAEAIRKDSGVSITTIVTNGRVTGEIANAVKENGIDIVIMGTNGADGLGEHFLGSNADRTAHLVPCPVITIHRNSLKAGFQNIILPIDNALHSRQKVNYAVALAKRYSSVIHIVGLLDKREGTELNKLQLKIEAIGKVLKQEGISYHSVIIEGNNLAVEALAYAKKEKGDLILALTDHESRMGGRFMGNFAKHIINHSDLPVMSIRPEVGELETVSLSAAEPF